MDDDAIARFVDAVVGKEAAANRNEDARFYAVMKEAFQALYVTPIGRLAFKSLLQHPSPHVRSWVAAQLLSEGDESAVAVMEALTKQSGLCGFSAQMTLAEHRKRRLRSPFASPTRFDGGVGGGEGSRWSVPASEESIQAFVGAVGMVVPEVYVQFLRVHNGGEGEASGEPGWIFMWPVEEVIELNHEYSVPEFFPGYFAFGSDGGGEILAFEVVNGCGGRVVMLPAVGEVADAVVVAESFNLLIAKIKDL